jgi:hypothetical protein
MGIRHRAVVRHRLLDDDPTDGHARNLRRFMSAAGHPSRLYGRRGALSPCVAAVQGTDMLASFRSVGARFCAILRRLRVGSYLVFLLALALPRTAHAHLGPPFPVIVDQPIPGYTVTVLTNPDVGQGIAYVVLERDKSSSRPAISSVDVWIQPLTNRLPKAVFHATLESSRGSLRYFAQPQFDAVERWNLGVDIRLTDGSTHPFVAQVDATPPGIGPWGLALFLAPIVLFGALFVLTIRKRRLAAKRARPQAVRVASGAKPCLPIAGLSDDKGPSGK